MYLWVQGLIKELPDYYKCSKKKCSASAELVRIVDLIKYSCYWNSKGGAGNIIYFLCI